MGDPTVSDLMNNIQTEDLTNQNNHSFSDIASVTESRTPEELMSEAAEVVESEKDEAVLKLEKTAKTEARTTESASEKQPQEAATELSEDLEEQMIEDLKLMKATLGDKEYDVPEDGMFKLKVDGEDTEVSLNELRNNYAGKTAWDKKFTELDSERQEYLQDRNVVESYVNQFREIAQSNNKTAALEFLAELSGEDPLSFKRDLQNEMFTKFQERQGLSEAEITAVELREENDFLRRQKESVDTRASESQTVMEAKAQLESLQEAHNLDNDTLISFHDQVMKEADQPLTDAQIIQAIENKAVGNTASQGAEYLLGKVDSTLINDQSIDAVKDIILENPDFTEDDLIDVINMAYDTGTKKKSVSKRAESSATTPGSTKKKAKAGFKAISFDDLSDY